MAPRRRMVPAAADGMARGDDARRMASFAATGTPSIGTSPAFRAQLRHAPSVRAVADFQFGPGDWEQWRGYEAITSIAYAHLPVWVLCVYDANKVPDTVLDGVWRTHPEVLSGDWATSDGVRGRAGARARSHPAPEALPGLRSLPRGKDLDAFGRAARCALMAEEVRLSKAVEMLVAGSEVAANSGPPRRRHRGAASRARRRALRVRGRRPRQRVRRPVSRLPDAAGGGRQRPVGCAPARVARRAASFSIRVGWVE